MKSKTSPQKNNLTQSQTAKSGSNASMSQISASHIISPKDKAIKVIEIISSMALNHDSIHKMSPTNVLSQQTPKEQSHLTSSIGNTGYIADGAPDIETLPADLTNLNNIFNDILSTPSEESYKRLLEEISVLKTELEKRDQTIDKLTEENVSLRREMEEFLTTVDEAREHIDKQLKECNKRIQELETEIHSLRLENKLYRQQLEQKHLSSIVAEENLEEEVDGYFGQAKKEVEDFYFQLNEQIIQFMDISKRQYQQFNKTIHHKMQEVKGEKASESLLSPRTELTQLSPLQSSRAKSSNRHSRTSSMTMTMSAKKLPSSPVRGNKTPDSKRKANNRNGDYSPNRSTEAHNGPNYNMSRKRGSCGSITHIETDSKNSSMFIVHDLNRKLYSNVVSPHSAFVRSSLKSDTILQKLKEKPYGRGNPYIK